MKYSAFYRVTLFLGLAMVVACSPTGVNEGNSHEQAPQLTPASVVTDRSLIITEPSVLRNPLAGAPQGPLHFDAVVKQLAGTSNVEQFMRDWVRSWESGNSGSSLSSCHSNGERPGVAAELLSAWKQQRIDLIAIVNRQDLAIAMSGASSRVPQIPGQGRLIYELRAVDGQVAPFTLIVEFALPGALASWASRWLQLSNLSLSDPKFSTALARITADFVSSRNLLQIRTNEFICRENGWELREYKYRSGRLVRNPLAQTPDARYKTSASTALANYVSSNLGLFLRGEHSFADAGPISLGLSAKPQPPRWSESVTTAQLPTGTDPSTFRQAMYLLQFNTCDGCHGHFDDQQRQIFRQSPNAPAVIGSFLQDAITTPYPLPYCGQDRVATWCTAKSWNEIAMRKNVLLMNAASGSRAYVEKYRQQQQLEIRDRSVLFRRVH